MRDFLDISKALSDPSRVRVLLALKDRELCACQIIELLGLAASTVSKHMTILRQADLVESRKEGRWAWYRRAGRDAPKESRAALRWLDRSLGTGRDAAKDARRLEKILNRPLEDLCRSDGRD